jgi:hypothetical protein
MATVGSLTDATGSVPDRRTSPETYTTLDTLLDQNKDFVIPELVQTYGEQGITGFLKLTGAINGAATNDQIDWWEAGRRHKTLSYSSAASIVSEEINIPQAGLTDGNSTASDILEKYDVVMDQGTGVRLIVKDYDVTQADDYTLIRLDGAACSGTDEVDTSNGGTLIVLGNMYAQGTDQPAIFNEVDAIKYTNPFAIVKGRHEVAGSQATNIGWVDVGGGEYRWFMYAEAEARRRFEDQREMILLFGEKNAGANAGSIDIGGTEGYFSAVEDRGIQITGGAFTAMSEVDDLIKQFDKQGAPAEYAMYLNRTQDLAIDDLLASGVATQVTAGLPGQFGAFNNDANMAVKLGFKSFTRGGYTFHKHDWKLMNDPTLAGAGTTQQYQGAIVPLSQVTDPRTGNRAPSLAMYYKAAGGYSREMEHWVTGGGMLGFTNGDTGTDQMVYHYRSEVALCVRAANQHAILKA